MNISLTHQQEQIINEALNSGQFQTAEEVIGEALIALRERTRSLASGSGPGQYEDAVREMLDFAEKNRTPLKDITVKQLIHEGHRL